MGAILACFDNALHCVARIVEICRNTDVGAYGGHTFPAKDAALPHHSAPVRHAERRSSGDRFAFVRRCEYAVSSCYAEHSNIHGAVAQLVERFVRIEEVVVSITISSTKAAAFIPPQRSFSFPSCRNGATTGAAWMVGSRRLRVLPDSCQPKRQ